MSCGEHLDEHCFQGLPYLTSRGREGLVGAVTCDVPEGLRLRLTRTAGDTAVSGGKG